MFCLSIKAFKMLLSFGKFGEDGPSETGAKQTQYTAWESWDEY